MCAFLYVYVCLCICMCPCVYVYVSVCVCVNVHVCMMSMSLLCIYVYVCMCVCCVCMYVDICVVGGAAAGGTQPHDLPGLFPPRPGGSKTHIRIPSRLSYITRIYPLASATPFQICEGEFEGKMLSVCGHFCLFTFL